MRMERRVIEALLCAVLAGPIAAGGVEPSEAAWDGPRLVSPGGRGQEGRVGTGCPSFSWTLVSEAAGYSVVVYEVSGGKLARPAGEDAALKVEIPAGATSWTPELGECLP